MAFTPQQARFRFYDDDNSATSATESAAQDTNVTADIAANVTYQLRIGIQETGGTGVAAPSQRDWQLQYSKNSGAWTDITAASSDVRAFASDFVSHGDSLAVSRLTGGTGSYSAGKISETGEVGSSSLGVSNHTELLYAIEIVAADLSDGDTLDFRVLFNDAVLDGGYSVTPRITADSGVSLVATLLTNTQTFYSHTISGGLTASLFVNQQTFFSHTLSTTSSLTLTASLLVNRNIFYSPTISSDFFVKDDPPPPVVVDPDELSPGIFDPAIFDPAIFDTGHTPVFDKDESPPDVSLE